MARGEPSVQGLESLDDIAHDPGRAVSFDVIGQLGDAQRACSK